MYITQLLSSVMKTLYRILDLCHLAWSPLFWFKIFRRLILQLTQEITSVLTFSQGEEPSSQRNVQCLSRSQAHSQADCDELRSELRRMQDFSTSSTRRLQKVEKRVEKLESDLCGEKETWKARFQELLREQHTLKEQEKYICMQDSKKEPHSDVTDGEQKPEGVVRQWLNRQLGDLIKTRAHGSENLTTSDRVHTIEGCTSHSSCLSKSSSVVSHISSTNGLESPKSFRVFAPRSPMDLKIGSRVKILLPSGRIGIGGVCNVGRLPGKAEFQVGVDLINPESWQQDVVFEGHRYLHCKQDHGVIVPFSKILMAWE
ncbi:uncharacterized protein WCC33_000499 isoform 2-T2 [Rhinophrynus dorsalis]